MPNVNRPNVLTQEYEHDNFGGEASRIETAAPGIFQVDSYFDNLGVLLAEVQKQPQDNGGYHIQINRHDPRLTFEVVEIG